jgi:hypothetical protein
MEHAKAESVRSVHLSVTSSVVVGTDIHFKFCPKVHRATTGKLSFLLYVLTSERKVALFRTLTVALSVGLFSKLAMKPTKPIIVLSP